jgi:AAA domain-containing protein
MRGARPMIQKKSCSVHRLRSFTRGGRAREIDIVAGLALSVECDQHPREAVAKLEAILGPATIVVASGGKWTDPTTGAIENKLHLHWRLKQPATGKDNLAKLKRARDLATRLVLGDPSNKSVVHPIRWPGSWHRKGEPKLCQITTANPDREIDLGAALAALTAAAPTEAPKPNNKTNGQAADPFTSYGNSRDTAKAWTDAVQGIIAGSNYHNAIVQLAAKMLTAGMSDDAAVNMLRAMMESSTAPRDARWTTRYADITRAVSTAKDKGYQREAPPLVPDDPPQQLIKSSKEFVAGFVPPEYVVVGLLQRRFIYALTGQTGAGKTAITLRLAASTALGLIFASRETKKVRVLYAAAENPDDVRMRWIALAPHMGFDLDTIEVYFTEGTFNISQMAAKLRAEAEKHGGDFGLVIIDTGPAFFTGDDENSRAQMGNHARQLRGLINIIPGGPCVVVNCHPTKNATADNLLPAGGGTFLNEMDGNLTAARDDSITTMHWQGKFRGPDFAPMHFLIKTVTDLDLKDSDDRLIPTVICEPLSDQGQEDIAAAARREEHAVLKFISENAKASQANIATTMGWKYQNGEPNKAKARRHIKTLTKDKLIKETRAGHYVLTDEGKKVLKGESD